MFHANLVPCGSKHSASRCRRLSALLDLQVPACLERSSDLSRLLDLEEWCDRCLWLAAELEGDAGLGIGTFQMTKKPNREANQTRGCHMDMQTVGRNVLAAARVGSTRVVEDSGGFGSSTRRWRVRLG